MKKITQVLTATLVVLGLSACSIAPGIPGLKTSSSRYEKPQKEGVDYKLVVINADTIRKQKPFDYAAYVKQKKKRTSVYDSQSNNSNSGYSGTSSNTSRAVNQARRVNSRKQAG